jgi:quercetin dioxygenase-like cupin family protein
MPGSIVPKHKHDGFDKAFYILEGELEMQMDGEIITVTPGYFINVGRGTVHGYRNVSPTAAKYLTWTSSISTKTSMPR